MKMQAPAHFSHFEMDNVRYDRDEDGLFVVTNPAHVKSMTILGATPHVEGDLVLAFGGDIRDAEIAALKAHIAGLESAAVAVPAPEVAETPVSASGGTSPPARGTTGTGNAMADALALSPEFEEMTRDELVDWLKSVGVVVPANVSRDNAKKAVDEAIADYQSGQKD